MCGIIGCISNDGLNETLMGLKSLEYRGYDSAGLFITNKGEEYLFKSLGPVDNLISKTKHVSFKGKVVLGHTRWATHGEPSIPNCHPHQSMARKVTLVHNGIIDNYKVLKETLSKKKYLQYISETDTEVLANLLEDKINVCDNDILRAIEATMYELKGTYAAVFHVSNETSKLFFFKKLSPLIVGMSKDGTYVVSDALAFPSDVKKYYVVQDNEYGYLEKGIIKVFSFGSQKDIQYESILVNNDRSENMYSTNMEKEINEIPSSIEAISRLFTSNQNIDEILRQINLHENICILGCGTSYHAGLCSCRFFKGHKVDCLLASMWCDIENEINDKTIFIVLSQSGETADLIKAIQMIKTHQSKIIAITNTHSSTISTLVDYHIDMSIGNEIAVASTKAFFGEVITLYLIATSDKEQVENVKVDIIRNLRLNEQVKQLAINIASSSHLFLIGRGQDYFACLEGALKIKEVAYIHAEAFYGGELKHGSLALIEKATPVIALCLDQKLRSSMLNNIEEIEARKGNVYKWDINSISENVNPFNIYVSDIKNPLNFLNSVVLFDYLALHLGKILARDIDRPRNLAKSVTVE